MKTTDKFRAALEQDFDRQNFNEGQKNAIIDRYEKLSAVKGQEFSFRVFYSSYGSKSDTDAKILTIKGMIEKELGDFNKVHPGVNMNPLVRLRQYIARHNELVDRASVSINGVDMTRAELDEAKLQVPNFAKDCVVYSATASTKAKGLSLTVVY